MKILGNVLNSLSVTAVIGMIIAIIHFIKDIKNKDNSTESVVGSIKEFVIIMAVLIVIEFTVNNIKYIIN